MDEKLNLKAELEDSLKTQNLDWESPMSMDLALLWAQSVAERVEEQTMQRMVAFYDKPYSGDATIMVPRLYERTEEPSGEAA